MAPVFINERLNWLVSFGPILIFAAGRKGADLELILLEWEISTSLMKEREKEEEELQADIVYWRSAWLSNVHQNVVQLWFCNV